MTGSPIILAIFGGRWFGHKDILSYQVSVDNDYTSFSQLPISLQEEAIREGERRLDAQLQIALAADQRAIAWGGILVAAGTAALGAGLALASKPSPDHALALLSLAFSGSMLRAAWLAVSTAKPDRFHLPGNLPSHWKPEEWNGRGTEARMASAARADQAACLTDQISKNAAQAVVRAAQIKKSFSLVSWTMACSAIAMALMIGARAVSQQDLDIISDLGVKTRHWDGRDLLL